MRIKSNFKDYYDYIQKYGCDEKIQYIRKYEVTDIVDQYKLLFHYVRNYHTWGYHSEITRGTLGVAGILYPVLIINKTNEYIFNYDSAVTLDILKDIKPSALHHYFEQKSNIECFKLVNVPIFMVLCGPFNSLIKNPNLTQMGFTKIPAELLFQKIAFFIANELTEQQPIIEIDNNSKIQKAGFDLKTSFRN